MNNEDGDGQDGQGFNQDYGDEGYNADGQFNQNNEGDPNNNNND